MKLPFVNVSENAKDAGFDYRIEFSELNVAKYYKVFPSSGQFWNDSRTCGHFSGTLVAPYSTEMANVIDWLFKKLPFDLINYFQLILTTIEDGGTVLNNGMYIRKLTESKKFSSVLQNGKIGFGQPELDYNGPCNEIAINVNFDKNLNLVYCQSENSFVRFVTGIFYWLKTACKYLVQFCSFRQSPLKVKALSMVCEFNGSPNQALRAFFSSTKRHANTDFNILNDNYWATKKELDGKIKFR